MILHGDCLEVMQSLPENSIDSVVTDPPYGIRFMGKAWDGDDIIRMTEERKKQQQTIGKDGRPRASTRAAPSESAGKYNLAPEGMIAFQEFSRLWAVEAMRILKPGGHLLSFASCRTYHRMACGIEDAGFEIRDQIDWLFGSGFPKNHDISKALDKSAGVEREAVGFRNPKGSVAGMADPDSTGSHKWTGEVVSNEAISDLAKKWHGWGSALKPGHEPIVLARKPLEKGLSIAENVAKWGAGAIWIDGCRIFTDDEIKYVRQQDITGSGYGARKGSSDLVYQQNPAGRWPANVAFDEAAAKMLDQQTGILKSGEMKGAPRKENKIYGSASNTLGQPTMVRGADSGGSSRFFYCAKASKKDRGDGNDHPTVKPVALMVWLIKLITPPGGTVLDPFAGSGTTGVAAQENEYRFIGIEKELHNVEIGRRRMGASLFSVGTTQSEI